MVEGKIEGKSGSIKPRTLKEIHVKVFHREKWNEALIIIELIPRLIIIRIRKLVAVEYS